MRPSSESDGPSSRAFGATGPVGGADFTDTSLMFRAAHGDEAALSVLYDRHAPLVFGLARAIVGAGADAEDVTAAVFTQLWRNAERFDPARGMLTAWLANITRSRALDLLRSRKREARVLQDASSSSDDELALPLAQLGSPPDAEVEADEIRRLVAESLEQLPEAQRQVLELAYFRGLSQSEIAVRLGQPLGTVKTRTRAAMAKLREALSAFQEGRR